MVRVVKVWSGCLVEFARRDDPSTTLLAIVRDGRWVDADTWEAFDEPLQGQLATAWLGYCFTE